MEQKVSENFSEKTEKNVIKKNRKREYKELTPEIVHEEYKKLGSIYKVAKKFNVDKTTIKSRLNKLGIDTSYKDKYSFLTKEKVKEIYEKFESIEKSAKFAGCSKDTFKSRMNKYSIRAITTKRILTKQEIENGKDIPENIQKSIKDYYCNNNVSMKKVSEKFEYNIKKINSIIKNAGLSRLPISRKHFFNENIFEKIDTEEKAYWLGFITADGWISENNYKLGFNLNIKDIKHLEKFKKFLNLDKKITKFEKKAFGKKFIHCQICANSKKICNDLSKFGIVQNKTNTIKPPILNKNLERHYWRGVVDGDGTVHFSESKKTVYIGLCGNQDIVYGFKSFIIINNIKTKAKINQIKSKFNFYDIQFGGKILTKKIAKLIYNDCNIFLDRKMEIANKILNLQNRIQ